MTRSFIIELELNAGSPKQNFTIKRGLNTLPGCQSDITETNGYLRSDIPPDDKPHKPGSYGVKTNLIESISWQWLYVTNLLIAYELILSIKDTQPNSTPYSWLPVEVAVAVGCLLKGYWNQDSLLFNPIERQATSMSTHKNHPFATIITMFGSGCNPSQQPPSESSGQQAPPATTRVMSCFSHLLFPDSGDGSERPEQHSHTLALNCFVDPCHGVCQFRASSTGREPAEWPLDNAQTPGIPSAISDDLIIINGLISLSKPELLKETGCSSTPAHSPPMGTSETQETTGSSPSGQSPSPLSQKRPKQATDGSRQLICDLTLVGKNGKQRPCWSVCKSTQALSVHKSRYHTGLKACKAIVVGKDGKQQPCRRLFMNTYALLYHKRRDHTGQQICDVTVSGEDGQKRSCGKTCKNAQHLLDHKRIHHTRQQTCNLTVVGKNGQKRLCGTICRNTKVLSVHKSKYHTGQKTCELIVAGDDDQSHPCGKVCKNAKALLDHKRRAHTGQQTCDVMVVGQDGQQQPCGTICKNAGALSCHKSLRHRKPEICYLTVIGQDGQPQPCGKVCKNPQVMANHKRAHRKRKPVDVDRNDDLSHQEGKVNK
ncbi:hypothetical protein [Endozoicomonas sp. 8E]|uniref:hypothetical protein n=1 Tax=Endozoicomonas sp. 8E TaxID=3035692 RepID=UPI002938FB6C|nr:hypothetical protein [Endozoicomonas sp. 8E]WOG27036.1 hypothetical protein P6910_21165 [Endozoicomonas sp. 8E]